MKKLSPKSPYKKPSIRTESLTAVAAVCNGQAVGGKKSTTSSPDFCNGAKLKS